MKSYIVKNPYDKERVLASFGQPDSDIMWNDTKGTMEVPPVSSTLF
jgi:hypothetical protein